MYLLVQELWLVKIQILQKQFLSNPPCLEPALGGRSGFCRRPLTLPELPTPSSLALAPAVTTFDILWNILITLQQTTAHAVTTFDRLTRFAIASHEQTSSSLAQTLCKIQALASFKQPLKLGICVVVTTTRIQNLCTSAFFTYDWQGHYCIPISAFITHDQGLMD